ncbi:hypothetical protein ACKUSY_01355 [Myroides odoratus]
MKNYNYIVSFLLAITIAVISFYPCADRYVAPVVVTDTVSTVLVETQHADHVADACSPFCACVCCAVSVSLTLPNYAVPHVVQRQIKEKTILPYPFVETVVYSIWQPPKLV